jgi:hypothetical protein
VRLATDLGALGIVLYLLQAGSWIAPAHPTTGNALATINNFVYYGLLSTAIGVAIVTLIDAWKLVRSARTRPTPLFT